ncbi:hypothetical protein M8J76_000640 [Diaphorina citri]|nr:hypothetical protein M8J76_000640 [Diaphorina citri]KAI5727462.1 hypothetical protein M8J77_002735 [Diaphorina citri]
MNSFLFCVLAVFAIMNCQRLVMAEDASAEATLTLFGQMKSNNELKTENPEHLKQFEKFIRDFSKSYPTKEEVAKRFAVFEDNLKLIEDLNKGEHGTATYGINHLSDLTREEMKSRLGLNLSKH